MTLETRIEEGDCAFVLASYPDDFFDLIVTSPPYADRRRDTYGGMNCKSAPNQLRALPRHLLA